MSELPSWLQGAVNFVFRLSLWPEFTGDKESSYISLTVSRLWTVKSRGLWIRRTYAFTFPAAFALQLTLTAALWAFGIAMMLIVLWLVFIGVLGAATWGFCRWWRSLLDNR